MYRVSREAAVAANEVTDGSGNEKPTTAESGSWFAPAAEQILGKDAGLHLHYATGWPERSCYYYAAGKREFMGEFLCALLRSDHGGPFLNALMAGCKAAWWLEHVERKKCADAYEAARTQRRE